MQWMVGMRKLLLEKLGGYCPKKWAARVIEYSRSVLVTSGHSVLYTKQVLWRDTMKANFPVMMLIQCLPAYGSRLLQVLTRIPWLEEILSE